MRRAKLCRELPQKPAADHLQSSVAASGVSSNLFNKSSYPKLHRAVVSGVLLPLPGTRIVVGQPSAQNFSLLHYVTEIISLVLNPRRLDNNPNYSFNRCLLLLSTRQREWTHTGITIGVHPQLQASDRMHCLGSSREFSERRIHHFLKLLACSGLMHGHRPPFNSLLLILLEYIYQVYFSRDRDAAVVMAMAPSSV